jgi:hypothetical protein
MASGKPVPQLLLHAALGAVTETRSSPGRFLHSICVVFDHECSVAHSGA